MASSDQPSSRTNDTSVPTAEAHSREDARLTETSQAQGQADLHGYETCGVCASPRKGVHAGWCPRHECDAELILKEAANGIRDRAATRDNEKEKSMTRTLRVFSQLVGHEPMPESEGWLFMACVKLGRSQQGGFHLDDYVDAAAYVALAGEAAAKESEYGRRKD